jgi:hypothetical protein
MGKKNINMDVGGSDQKKNKPVKRETSTITTFPPGSPHTQK